MGARNSRRENPKVPQIDPRGEKAAETGKEKQNKRLRARLRSYIGEQFCHYSKGLLMLMYTTGMGGGEMNKDGLIMIC